MTTDTGGSRSLLCAMSGAAWQVLQSQAPDGQWMSLGTIALERGLARLQEPPATPETRLPWPTTALRFRGILAPVALRANVELLAQLHFQGNRAQAAGWLLGRGLGLHYDVPRTAKLPIPVVHRHAPLPQRRSDLGYRGARKERGLEQVPEGVYVPTGLELRAKREALHVTQRTAARHAGISRGLLSEIEAGRRTAEVSRWKFAVGLDAAEQEARDGPPPAVPTPNVPDGATLRAERRALGAYQWQIAALMGVTRSFVSDLESGHATSAIRRLRYADALRQFGAESSREQRQRAVQQALRQAEQAAAIQRAAENVELPDWPELRVRRLALGVRQRVLAGRLGYSRRQTLGKLEAKHLQAPEARARAAAILAEIALQRQQKEPDNA